MTKAGWRRQTEGEKRQKGIRTVKNENTAKFLSGFAAIVGRPNVGKSTLMNAMVGEKVAIVSNRPQTTRNRIMGVATDKGWQIVFLDTPGLHKPRTRLGEYMVKSVQDAMDGIDVLLGIARFWAGRVHYSKRANQYMIHGVTGPNEYENNVNNNWYTNRMTAWELAYTAEQLMLIPREKAQTLGVNAEEIRRFREISEKMYLPYDEELGVFVQHDTFLDKDLMPADALSPADRPLNQKWSWDRILRSCFIKQADVLQGLYFLEHLYDKETIRRNFDFYEPMTVHESSLSPCVHSILAASLGKLEKAQELYRRTARLDLDNINNDTCDGLHITSMAGSWLSIVQGFAGMRTLTGSLSFDPQLPDGWDGYAFKIVYRGRLIEVSVSREGTGLKLLSGEALTVMLHGHEVRLSPAEADA